MKRRTVPPVRLAAFGLIDAVAQMSGMTIGQYVDAFSRKFPILADDLECWLADREAKPDESQRP